MREIREFGGIVMNIDGERINMIDIENGILMNSILIVKSIILDYLVYS
jgi:hypothetical protein